MQWNSKNYNTGSQQASKRFLRLEYITFIFLLCVNGCFLMDSTELKARSDRGQVSNFNQFDFNHQHQSDVELKWLLHDFNITINF